MRSLIIGLLFIYSCQGFAQFTTTWNTGNSTSITIPTTGAGYNYTATIALLDTPATIITTLTGTSANPSFTALTANTSYQVKITGAFPRIYFNTAGDRLKIKAITQWGNIAWTSFERAFSGCTALTITATDTPVLTGVTNMSAMFHSCSILNGPANIGDWNTASVTNMAGMFTNALVFNQSLSGWNTGAVIDMNYMFFNAPVFNQDVSNWNTASVTNMSGMFQKAVAFNQDISAWNTMSVTNMNSMFYEAAAFNGDIGGWNTASVTTMDDLFRGAAAFNQDIGNWNTAAVTSMSSLFLKAAHFNQDISNWDTGAVEIMGHMFEEATAFNQDIGNWDVSSVWNMQFMFQKAAAFNQDLGNWDISAVLYMDAIFKQATAFNQNLAAWAPTFNPAVVGNSSFGGLLENCGMSVDNYDATLVGFNALGPNGINLGAVGMFYCNEGSAARVSLVRSVANGGKGWTITGDTSLVTAVPLLATAGTTSSLINVDCNFGWAKATNKARKMLMINENGNDISPSNAVINHSNIGTLPSGVTSNSGYYQISNATHSTRISNRLTTITAPGNYIENGGVIVRVYYSTTEYTNLLLNAPPVGDIVDAGWFVSDADSAAAVVADMSAGNYALPSAQKIVPFNSGSESGISFVEFKIAKMGTIGLYAKTAQGSLSPELGVETFSAANKAVVYPNPAENILNVALPDRQEFDVAQISIVNLLGQTVYKTSQNTNTINVSFLSAGIYQLFLETDQGSWNAKFVKK